MKILKTSLAVLFIFLGTQNLHAQVQNTSWKGIFNVPSPAECVLQFISDTALITMDGNDLEISKFKINGDTLTLQKLSGGSPCDTEVIGIYRFKVKDDKLIMTVIDDACQERAMALPQEPMTAVKN